jgi:hypothetical protein
MSKRKAQRTSGRKARRVSSRKKYASVAALSLAILLGFGVIAGPLSSIRGLRTIRSLILAPPAIPAPGNPSKEYIYAGGKLIATEAPVTLVAPAGLVATTLSYLASPQVTISWSATPGADHYSVERTANIGVSYTVVNSNVGSTSFTDNSVNSVTAYLYRVRAVDANGNVSPYSNLDLATAISFTDDTIQIGNTTVKAAHINELRQAVDAVRATANLGAVNWGGSITAGVTTVQAAHIQSLRTNLDQARSVLGLSACSYTNASAGVLIQKTHMDELRQCVR